MLGALAHEANRIDDVGIHQQHTHSNQGHHDHEGEGHQSLRVNRLRLRPPPHLSNSGSGGVEECQGNVPAIEWEEGNEVEHAQRDVE